MDGSVKMLYRLFSSKVLDWALLLPEVQPLMPLELKIISLFQFPPFNSSQSRSKHKNIRTCWFALITQLKRYRVIALNKLNYGTKIRSHRKDREFVYSYGISWLIHETSYQYQFIEWGTIYCSCCRSVFNLPIDLVCLKTE